jgi:predicted O-methyltransferase YrrM
MNAILSQILETNQVTTPEGQTLELHSHISPLACQLIQAWITEHHPHRLLEIGFAYGISSLFICDAISARDNISYHIIDAFQSRDWHSVGLFNLNRAGFEDLYTFYEERSEICLPHLLDQGMTFDFALIDGMHTFDHALVDFFYINRMLEVGGIVVFDDFQMPSIRKLVAHVSTYDCYTPLPFPESFRLQARVFRMIDAPFRLAGFKKIADDDRKWDWHRDF